MMSAADKRSYVGGGQTGLPSGAELFLNSDDQGPDSANSRHSRTGWIEVLPLLDPLVQPEPEFQFDQTVSW